MPVELSSSTCTRYLYLHSCDEAQQTEQGTVAPAETYRAVILPSEAPLDIPRAVGHRMVSLSSTGLGLRDGIKTKVQINSLQSLCHATCIRQSS